MYRTISSLSQTSAPQRQKARRRRDSSSRGYGSDQNGARSAGSRASSQRSVDSVLIEHFPPSDSSPSSSLRGPQSSASDFEPPKLGRRGNRFRNIVEKLLIKRQARRILEQLIIAAKGEDESAAAQLQRCNAAAGLVRIIEEEPSGGQILARRFVKSASREAEGIRALLKLSDDELGMLGNEAISTTSTPTASRKLLDVLLKHSNESSFLRESILPRLRDGSEGPAAILYLATEKTHTFFAYINEDPILDFCKRVVSTQEVLSLKWCCAVRLLCRLFEHTDDHYLEEDSKFQCFLYIVLKSFINTVMEEVVLSIFQYRFIYYGLPILPLLAMCCEWVESNQHLEALASSTPFKPFLESLIHFVFPQDLHPRRLTTEDGLGIFVLISFLRHPSVAKLFLDSELSSFGSFLVDVALHLRTLDFEYTDTDDEGILRRLTGNEDVFITCLCSLPAPVFSHAMSGALKEGMARLSSRNTYSYKPLALVERLLWLSNMKIMEEQIHRALVEGRACECLAQALTYTGGLDPDDRGLWRGKGLAMTCLGNIIERMNKEQFCNYIREEIIASVVGIKEDAAVPLVQKGQAIFLLQRYTLAADRLGVQPSHREDTSNVAEESRGANPGGPATPPSPTDVGFIGTLSPPTSPQARQRRLSIPSPSASRSRSRPPSLPPSPDPPSLRPSPPPVVHPPPPLVQPPPPLLQPPLPSLEQSTGLTLDALPWTISGLRSAFWSFLGRRGAQPPPAPHEGSRASASPSSP